MCRERTFLIMAGALMAVLAGGNPIVFGDLRVLTPDFLQPEWLGPASCFQSATGIPLILEVQEPNDIRDMLLAGYDADLAMVWDGHLEALELAAKIEHFNVADAYFPVLYDVDIVGVRIPWAEGYTAVIPTASFQQTLSRLLLKHSCV